MQQVPAEAKRRQLITLIPANMNALMMGCAIGWLPIAIYFLTLGEEVHATSSECNIIATLSQVGKLVFSVPGGMVIDKYGRRKVIIGVAFLNFCSWLVLSLSTSLDAIYVGQFTLGVGQALVQESSLITIGEIASPAIRGQLSSIYQIFLSVGVILPAAVSVIFSSYVVLTWIVTLFSVVSLVSMIITTETPSFLISISELNRAKENLMKIRLGCPVDETDAEFETLKKYIRDEKALKDQTHLLAFLKVKSTRDPLLISILIKFFTTGTGRSLITTYVTTIIPFNEFVGKKYYALIMQVIILVINISTTFYIEKFPRRTILLFGAVAVTISNTISAFVNYCYFVTQLQIFMWSFILGNVVYLIFSNGAVQPINSTMKTELFPQSIKGVAGSLSILSQAISTLISYQTYHFIDKYFHLYYMYVVLAANSLVLSVIVYFFLPESRGSSLAEVQLKFKDGRLSRDDGSKKSIV